MLNSLLNLARPLLLTMQPERAHEITLQALEAGIYGRDSEKADPALKVAAMGLAFPNPIGIAAGFDKDARVYNALLAIGFGFSEVGTVTPRPQEGNPTPRVFRLPRERAIINRLGFNSNGQDLVYEMLSHRTPDGIIGVNIGSNKDTSDKATDYAEGVARFYDLADYFMVNVSSPNTPGLRGLQVPEELDGLLKRLNKTRDRCADASGRRVPVAVKLAPDISMEDLPAITDRLLANCVDAIAVSNTTLARPPGLDPRLAHESGGLSGQPLFHRSTVMLAQVYKMVAGAVPLIGIGGISSGETARAKIEAGATLIQLYTGLVYEGLPLLPRIKSHLRAAVKSAGASGIGDLVGAKADEWAAKPLNNA